MKIHTQTYKEQIKELGREIDSRIIFGETVITSEELFSISPVTNADLLKSVMKQLNFESSIQVPQYTVIKYQFGLKINDSYEYIDFGNYIVYSSEYNEDTSTYEHTCYDSMLFSMKDYTTLKSVSILGKTFPMSVRDYLTCLCTDIGLVFKNSNDIFANYDKIISSDLYANLGYTYRDIFDELSQVTASNICIDSNDMLEVRYINDTNDIIDDEYLKDINVKFGEKYGPINSVVLSRSSESDNVYLQDEQSVTTNGLCEIKISDNQIMNNNDRSDYLPDILSTLNGLEYYLNDFTSTGIMYYELCDKYNVKIGENTYSCVLFNDEPKITQGLVENIYTERPKESVTDYTKADKTDRKINRTTLIVDKQNQKIQSVIEQTNEQNQKIAQVSQTVAELNSKIGDIADITASVEDNDAQVELSNINQSEPIKIVIRPISENISYLYPNMNLFPSENLFSKIRTIRFNNITTNEFFDYELPEDLLYYDADTYDEFILDYDEHSCIINKKVGYNADGTTYALETPTTNSYDYPLIELSSGDYTISVLGYQSAYIFARLMTQNIYTTQFYTKSETNSAISQSANSISSEIDQKLSNYSDTTEMNNKITQEINKSENKINIEVSKKVNNTEYTKANIIAKINDNTSEAQINADVVNLTANDILNLIAGNAINLTSKNITILSDNFKVDKNGNLECSNATAKDLTINNGNINLSGTSSQTKMKISRSDDANVYTEYRANTIRMIVDDIVSATLTSLKGLYPTLQLYDGVDTTSVSSYGITTPKLTQTSLAENKKNFEKYKNALNELKKIDIYKYNLKSENDSHKKHLGFVIGKDYNYSHEITSTDDNGKEIGVDNYSMASLCLQAIKEQQVQIELLTKEIKRLKKEVKLNEKDNI